MKTFSGNLSVSYQNVKHTAIPVLGTDFTKIFAKPGMVAHSYNPNTQEVEGGGSQV
jgi:hypothetical protein